MNKHFIKKFMTISGNIIGYDPGGNGNNGFTTLEITKGIPSGIKIETLSNAEAVINHINQTSNILSIGIDTLSCWCSGQSGWRPADRWLKSEYPLISNSISSPNSLFGAMAINGMSVLIEISKRMDLTISETHPKVLYYALTSKKYDYSENNKSMDEWLSKLLSLKVNTENEHEWDSVISAYTLLKGITGSWEKNLHDLPLEINSRIITPCGKTSYFWPD